MILVHDFHGRPFDVRPHTEDARPMVLVRRIEGGTVLDFEPEQARDLAAALIAAANLAEGR